MYFCRIDYKSSNIINKKVEIHYICHHLYHKFIIKMDIEYNIMQYCKNNNIIYAQISNQNINIVHKILFHQYIPSLNDHPEILYYYALLNHINKKYHIALIFYKKIITCDNMSNEIVGCTYNNLGILYKNGDGIKSNINCAIKYLELSVEYNIRVGMYNLANAYKSINNNKSIEMYNKSIELGSCKSIMNLAAMYTCNKQNVDKAIELYEKAITIGHNEAYYELAHIYLVNEYKKQNINKAIELYKKSIEFGFYNSINYLATIYRNGDHVIKNIHRTIEIYEEAIKNGFVEAYSDLANIYKCNFLGKYNINKAIELYEKAIELGDYNAVLSLAEMYINGDGVPRNIDKVIHIYEQAIKNGIHKIYLRLASIYNFNKYGKQNIDKAIELYENAIMVGQIDAYYPLFNIYFIENNADTAIKLCKIYATSNYDALDSFARLYETDIPFKKTVDRTLDLYEIALNMENHKVMNMLNLNFLLGNSHPKNYNKALKLFHQAFNINNDMAAKNIAIFYHHGYGVCSDLDIAAKYYAIHCNFYNKDITHFIDLNTVDWTCYLHKFWHVDNIVFFNKQIITLLLISKNRKFGKYSNFFVKGLCLIVVKFLMNGTMINVLSVKN